MTSSNPPGAHRAVPPMLQSLRFKILLMATLLVAVTLVGAVGPVLFSAATDVDARIRHSLHARGGVFDQLMRSRSSQLLIKARLLAADYAFREAVLGHDTETIGRVLEIRSSRVGADIAIVMTPDGQVLATTGNLATRGLALPTLISQAEEEGRARAIFRAEGTTYEMITVPVTASGPVAWISMGYAIDDRLAWSINKLTGLEIVVLGAGRGAPRVLGTTFTGVTPTAIAQAFTASARGPGRSLSITLDNLEYQGIQRSFLPDKGEISVLLLESVYLATASFRKFRWHAILVSGFGLVLALLGAFGLSRTVTRPIRRMLSAAQRIGEGDYSHAVEIRSRDEIGQLAAAFNSMQQGIADREERITYQARFDSLTGLPNRLLALERLTETLDACRQSGQCTSLLLVDLDRFSAIGSSLGHEIGDALLSQAAERLRASLDARHTLARLEADEFLIVLANVGVDAARAMAEDLLRLLSAGLSVQHVSISLDARIGISSFPDHGSDPAQLLRRAAVAKNDAKQADEPIHVYQHGREERHVRQLAILGDLRRAVRHDELKLYLQPKLDLKENRVCGAEALVRWEHPTLGFLPPGEFIPIAEQYGNISLITHWAVTAAVRECRLWLEDGLDLPVSVNLSGRDLQNQNLPYFILEILRDHDLDARYLMLEITEEALVCDFAHATLVLECLRDLGTKISIDDFGTGYSSLAQIKHLPVDELKIDRSFVMELPDNREDVAIVRAAIELAHSLGMEALAEGVETRPALRWLADNGCERAQGFLISRPMPAETFSQWVRQLGQETAPQLDPGASGILLSRHRA